MKKLLVLMLVLSLASAASATLSLSLNGEEVPEITVAPSDMFIVDIHSDIAQAAEFWVGITGPASYTGYGTLIVPPAPSGLVVDDGGYGTGWIQGRMDTATVDALAGEWWTLELHCDGEGDVIVDLYDAAGGTIIDTVVVHQIVPEPMTIALLGLGGLLLRRRKA